MRSGVHPIDGSWVVGANAAAYSSRPSSPTHRSMNRMRSSSVADRGRWSMRGSYGRRPRVSIWTNQSPRVTVGRVRPLPEHPVFHLLVVLQLAAVPAEVPRDSVYATPWLREFI